MDSLRIDTLRVANTMTRMYPISGVSIERSKFDPQLMINPDIKGVEYQQGRCVYCRCSKVRLELDHVRPRAVGSDRVDNLVACCRVATSSRTTHPSNSSSPTSLSC